MTACARSGPAAEVAEPSTATSQTATTSSTSTVTARVISEEPAPENSPASSSGANTAVPTLSCAQQSWIKLSLVPDFVGQPSPIEAARWFVVQSWVDGYSHTADAAWTAGPTDELGTSVTTEGVVLHALQLPNQTWAIDSATRCA